MFVRSVYPAFVGSAVAYGSPKEGGNKTVIPVRRKNGGGEWEYTGRFNVTEGRNSEARTKVQTWRAQVSEAVKSSPLWAHAVLTGPLVVRFYFTIKRPQRVPPERLGFPAVKPDADKLIRATSDAITDSGLWKDDALIISTIISKAYVGMVHADGTPAMDVSGCVIDVYEMREASS